MKKNILFILTFFFFFSTNLFAKINVINPVDGKYANKQMLMIEVQDNAEYFFSLDGEDPKTFGFAYDGPVLIDITGDVTLRIQKRMNNKEEEVTVKYFVEPDNYINPVYYDFVTLFYDTGVLNYTSGTSINIPKELYYSIGYGKTTLLPGQEIMLSENSVLNRTIPCELLDKETNQKYRFLINIFPQNHGIFTKREMPFSITDWENIEFINQDFIYRIDNEYWELPKAPKKIDRSVPHTIYWQSIDYNQGNPISSFYLPSKPEIKKEINYDSSLLYKFSGDDTYQMGILSSDNDYKELFYELGIDTFFGDYIQGKITIGVFYDSVFQGNVVSEYEINKRPPSSPIIQTAKTDFYSRESLTTTITCDAEDELYVSISEPFIIKDSSQTYTKTSDLFLDVEPGKFLKARSNKINFTLDSTPDGACYYLVKAYAKNKGAQSAISEFSVIIDKNNYYYCESSTQEKQDGTIDYPYKDFNECLKNINNSRFAKLMIKGQMHIPSGTHELLSNCTFINQEAGEIIFSPESTIVIKTSSLELENFTILLENDTSFSDKINSLFKLESGTLDLVNCQLGATFSKNANLIESFNSSLNVKDCIISVTANKYSAFFSGTRSNLNISNSIINTNGKTCVLLSLNQGNIKVTDSSFKLTGQIGRTFELFGVYGNITKNDIKADLQNINSSLVIFKDDKCNVKYLQNTDYALK